MMGRFYIFILLIVFAMLQSFSNLNPGVDASSLHGGNDKSSIVGAFFVMGKKGKPVPIGAKFGRLTVLEEVEPEIQFRRGVKTPIRRVKCKCDCGKIIETRISSIKAGKTNSCGCLWSERIVASITKHGEAANGSRTQEYSSWYHMIARCYDEKHESYENYGGRGIRVCDRWRHSFENFLEDMGRSPSEIHTLDRFPDKNGNYEPSNCRWATPPEQNRNTNRNVWLEYNGERMVLADWAIRLKVKDSSFYAQYRRKGKDKVFDFYKNKGLLP